MANAIHWYGPLFVSKRAEPDVAVLKTDVEFVPEYIYWEKQILIEALERWLRNWDYEFALVDRMYAATKQRLA